MAINKPSSLAVLSAGLAVVLSVGAAGAQEPADRWYGAIRDNNLNAVESLAKSGSVNEKDKRGSTPLMHAAAFGSIEAMRILLVHGADVNARNDFGATALMWAIGDQEKARFATTCNPQRCWPPPMPTIWRPSGCCWTGATP
jgi:Ankyrin repeats (3 copies)